MVAAPALSLALGGMAVLALPAGGWIAPLRRLGVRGEAARPDDSAVRPMDPPVSPPRRRAARPVALAVAVGLTVTFLVGLPVGPPVGVVAAWGTVRWGGRLERAGHRRARSARRAELPAVLDLLAVCLSTGLPLESALDLVATALPGALSADLRTVAGLHRLGAGSASAWHEARADPLLGPVARAAIRSGESGSALALAFERLAAEHRADGGLRAEAWARRAGVAAMAPLGLCFLPAFVCLGVVPVVVGIAHQILGTALTGSG